MPYDENLVKRIRGLIHNKTGFSEKKMFGGLAFFFNGNMLITVSGEGGILARVGPDSYKDLCSDAGVDTAVMRGKKMKGWLRVSVDHLQTEKELQCWFDYCLSFSESLPAKDS